MRQRKRPKYLNDFVQNSNDAEDSIIESKSTKKQKVAADGKFQSEHEENDFEEKLVESEAGQCCLCDEKLTGRSIDIQTSTGSSEASYATILNSVFKADSEQNFTSEKNSSASFFNWRNLLVLQGSNSKFGFVSKQGYRIEEGVVEQNIQEIKRNLGKHK